MNEQQTRHVKAKTAFEDLWTNGDPWDLDTSELDQSSHHCQIQMLGNRRFQHVLEIGCGAGAFTRRLSGISEHVSAIDVASPAIERARRSNPTLANVDFRVANIMEFDLGSPQPWDLVVMSETIYYLGWIYTFFEVGWLVSSLCTATPAHSQFLMANTHGGSTGHLLETWLIRTYRDLFRNVGYRVLREEPHTGVKNGVSIDILITLFGKETQAFPEATGMCREDSDSV